MISVCASAPRYRAAIAELAATVTTAGGARGAVCVVGGLTWWGDARLALSAGAAGVVVERPLDVPREAVDDLRTLAGGRPVIVERHDLREDAVEGVVPNAMSALALEGVVSSLDAAALRDAVGWLRVLGRGEPRIVTSRAAGSQIVASLSVHSADALSGQRREVPVSVVLSVRDSASPWIRVSVLGPERVDVVSARSPREPRVTRSTVDGQTLLTRPRQSAARLALGRAADAVAGGTAPDDLRALLDDEAIARALAGSTLTP